MYEVVDLPSHGPGSHNPGSGQDIVHGDVAVVLDVLHLNAYLALGIFVYFPELRRMSAGFWLKN